MITAQAPHRLGLRAALLSLVAAFLVGVVTPTPASAVSACAGVDLLHRPTSDQATARPFYSELANGSTLRSGYAGYSFADGTFGSYNDLWINISTFSSGALSLATNQSADIPVRTLSQESATKRLAYVYLRGNSATTTLQTFKVTVSSGKLGTPGATTLCEISDGFSRVEDVIDASANKVTSVTVSTTTPAIGGSFYVTAKGNTGTIGAGIAGDQVGGFGVISVAPSMNDSWPADAFTLVGISWDFGDTGTFAYDRLRYYPNASSNTPYTARYYFAARKTTSQPTPIRPVQNIASGTQIKYTGSYDAAAQVSIAQVTQQVSITKAVSSVTLVSNVGNVRTYDVSYEISAQNRATTATFLDSVVDSVTVGATGVITAPGAGGSVVGTWGGAPETGTVLSSVGDTSRSIYFAGPLEIPGSTTRKLAYTVRLTYPDPLPNPAPITNTAAGQIGADTINALSGANIVSLDLSQTVRLSLVPANSTISTAETATTGACSATGSTTADCDFIEGSVATIQVTPPQGQALAGWTVTWTDGSAPVNGTTCGNSPVLNPCQITLSESVTVTPVFSTSYTVTIVDVGDTTISDGTGQPYTCVTSGSPAVTTCTKTYASGTTIPLTFTPATSETITAVTDSPAALANNACTTSCSLPNLAGNVTLTLTRASTLRYALSAGVSGSGSVSGTSGINLCTETTGVCASTYLPGFTETITATPAAGWRVKAWSGACTGTGATCVLTMSTDRSFSIEFELIPVVLQVTVTGQGSVSADSGAVSSCDATSGTCSGTYQGETVILTATPPTGWRVKTWGSACSGTATTCSVTMDQARNVTIEFELIPAAPSNPPAPIREIPSTDPASPKNIPPSNTTGTDPGQIPVGPLPPNSSLEVAKDKLPPAINDAKLNNGVVEYTPAPGFSGKTVVPLLLTQNGVQTIILVPVTVNPVAPSKGEFTPTAPTNTNLGWDPSPNATGYKVYLNGKLVCETTKALTCSVKQILGPKAKLTVEALGNDGTVSKQTLPVYAPKRPIPVLVVNFAVDSFRVTPLAKRKMDAFVKMMREQGFTRVVIEGHTDNQGGAVGAQALSRNRARVVAAYLDNYLDVTFTRTQFGEKRPTAPNTTSKGQAANRRATGAVW